MLKHFYMIHLFNRFFPFIAIVILISCQSDLGIDNIIDYNSPFELTETTIDTITGLSKFSKATIEANSVKWQKLVEFAKCNTEGWTTTPASYISDITIAQGDFRLLYWIGKSAIIISFKDKNGKMKQYHKEIKNGELDFLISKK